MKCVQLWNEDCAVDVRHVRWITLIGFVVKLIFSAIISSILKEMSLLHTNIWHRTQNECTLQLLYGNSEENSFYFIRVVGLKGTWTRYFY